MTKPGTGIPLLDCLSSNPKEWLTSDLVAGLTTSAVVVPQAMAYAAIAGLPLAVGLYTALVPLAVYALMGTSRPLSVSTTSTIAILTGGALARIAPSGDSSMLMTAAATLTLLVGVFFILAAILRLGVIANFISESVLIGFKAGVGLVIIADQIPHLLGIHISKGHIIHTVTALTEQIRQTSLPTLVLALSMLGLFTALQRFVPRVPASLVTVAAGVTVSAWAGLQNRGIELVGEVQAGLPAFALPELSLVGELWPAALGITLMSFVESVAAGRAFARHGEPRPAADKELLALGLANLAGGFFHAMPAGGGTSQTAVNSKAGARSQVAGLMTATVVMATLFFLAPIVHLMPQATLAAVVVIPCVGMIQLNEFRHIRQVRLMEWSWALVAVAGVMIFGTLQGIIVAVVLSLFAMAFHSNHPPVFVLGRKPGTDVFRPRSAEHPEDQFFPGLLLIKTEGSIHFANAQRVGEKIWPLIEELRPRVVVLDCSAVPDIEYTALKMLTEAEEKLRETGIALWLAALNPGPLQVVHRSPLSERLGRERLLFNLEQAVTRYQQEYGVQGQ
jgi:high affinity sulfate transporter 1